MPICCTKRICLKFQGRKKRKNFKSVTTGKTCELFSISYHGFVSGLQTEVQEIKAVATRRDKPETAER